LDNPSSFFDSESRPDTANHILRIAQSRCLAVLLLAALLFWPVIAQGQTVSFNLSTAPTPVANTGRSEVMGQVVLTADLACGTNADGFCVSAAGTIQVLYLGTPIDNNIATLNINTLTTNGIEVCESIGAFTCNAAGTYLSGVFVVTNTDFGGVVSFGVKGGVNIAAGDQLQIRGVRGQIDLSLGSVPGSFLSAQLTSSPSTIASFSPTGQLVAISADPLTIGFSVGTLQQCSPSGRATVTVTEGFTTAFVDSGGTLPVDPADSVVTANPRPLFAPTSSDAFPRVARNSRINIVLTSRPAGVTITWPATSAVDTGPGTTGARLNKVAQSSSGDQVLYTFSSPNQGLSDINTEGFNINLDGEVLPVDGSGEIALSSTSADLGTATAQGQMFDTAASISQPRYNHPLEPSVAATFLTVQSCPVSDPRRSQTVAD
jgi:hypothetical protein